ncbi:MAG: hypothetical protein WCK15_24065 [Pirellula sp.]|jgi:hypothetical protein
MKESYKEDLASNFGLELYADDGNGMGVATTGVYAGKLMSYDAESKKGTQLNSRRVSTFIACLRAGQAATVRHPAHR